MITIRPISDVVTTGWTHTGSGDYYEDIDESPDSPDSQEIGFDSDGSFFPSCRFQCHAGAIAGVTSGLARIRCGSDSANLYRITIADGSGSSVLQRTMDVFIGDTDVHEFTLPGVISTPADLSGAIIIISFDPHLISATISVSCVEVILYQGDEPGGGPGPSNIGAAMFLQMCGIT